MLVIHLGRWPFLVNPSEDNSVEPKCGRETVLKQSSFLWQSECQAEVTFTIWDADHHMSSWPRKWMDHTQAKSSIVTVLWHSVWADRIHFSAFKYWKIERFYASTAVEFGTLP